jgi:Mg/Co/Ni transporter MgtE
MEPDDAADLLSDLPDAHAEQLLQQMEPEEAADVKELLAYEEETAGGVMTTEYIAIAENMTADDTIGYVRQLAPRAESAYYLYVIDADERLVGVLSLRDLIVADPATCVVDFMVHSVRHVQTGDDIAEVAQIFGRYNLLALPVVDDDSKLVGIVTVDDIMELLLPPERRRRIPQLAVGQE